MADLENQLRLLPPPEEGGLCPTDLIRQYAKLIREQNIVDPGQVPVFSSRYPTIFDMICKGGDLSLLDLFLNKIDKIKQGKEVLENTEKELANVLNDRYVVPKLAETSRQT